MPLVVERMMQGSGGSEGKEGLSLQLITNHGGNTNHDEMKEEVTNKKTSATNGDKKSTSLLFRTRNATLLGASMPILLSLIWAGISTALISPTISNPLKYLLVNLGKPAISIPVGLLATGAIGTTLLGSFLAIGHFMGDIVCSVFGQCSFTWINIANALTVAVPSILACVGPALYLPLLSFAGAYPTTILHGLSPALAVLVLRRKLKRGVTSKGSKIGSKVTEARIVPGGDVTLIGLVSAALGLIGASTFLALRHVTQAMKPV
mmetsp:Transcript_29984/g.44191  ORF Transcript_29984/g.44191 Transcript_29984/m.44191 type:complete len:263 (-) Transcript_29984:174-962(-)